MHNFYRRFIRPLSDETDQAEREIVLNILLIGTFWLSVLSFFVTLLAPLYHEAAYPGRLANSFATSLFILGLYFVSRRLHHYRIVATLLTLLIALFGCFIAFSWSILDPYAVLLLSLAVIMAGILINARYSLYLTICLVPVLIYLQHGQVEGFIHPDLAWLDTQPVIGDVVGLSAILFVIALVSWLFNRQMEMSLHRARRSEAALKRQAALLEIKVEKRAQQLEAAQLEKMQEVYRFAELGRLSTALFHDLANHLSSVSLDIEGLSAESQSDIMRRIGENIHYIDTIVQRVRRQIRGENSVEVFKIVEEAQEVLKIMSLPAAQAKVVLEISIDPSVKRTLLCKGDIIRFRQIILNLLSNAVEAYGSQVLRNQDRTVQLSIERQGTTATITVTDHGRGIKAKDQAKIFHPFYTTKPKGAGIGLFLVQQIVEHDFGGSLAVTSTRQTTSFVVTLPKSYYARAVKA